MSKTIEFLDEKIIFSGEFFDDSLGGGACDNSGWHYHVDAPFWLDTIVDFNGPTTSKEWAYLDSHCRNMFLNENKTKKLIAEYLESRKDILQIRKVRMENGFSLLTERMKIVNKMDGVVNDDGTVSVFTDKEEIFYSFNDEFAVKKEDILVEEIRRENIKPPQAVVCPVCGKKSTVPETKLMITMFGNCGCQKGD